MACLPRSTPQHLVAYIHSKPDPQTDDEVYSNQSSIPIMSMDARKVSSFINVIL